MQDINHQKGVQGEQIKASKERTESTGYESSAMKDIFGNFNKYSIDPKKN